MLRDRTDYKVVFTRDRDVFIPLIRRGQIANDQKGKLFISIHVNATAARTTKASGASTYFLKPGRDEESIRVAERENKVAFQYEDDDATYEGLLENDHMQYEILHSGTVAESEELASLVQKHVVNRTGATDRGVKQGWLVVLKRASMPHVLCEVGFINNAGEARRLATRSYRQKIAEGIFHGIQEYAARRQEQLASTPAL